MPMVVGSDAVATIRRHDYLPFGEELSAGSGGRTTQQGYVVDNVRQGLVSARGAGKNHASYES
jgi:hypothetical protein